MYPATGTITSGLLCYSHLEHRAQGRCCWVSHRNELYAIWMEHPLSGVLGIGNVSDFKVFQTLEYLLRWYQLTISSQKKNLKHWFSDLRPLWSLDFQIGILTCPCFTYRTWPPSSALSVLWQCHKMPLLPKVLLVMVFHQSHRNSKTMPFLWQFGKESGWVLPVPYELARG